MTAPKRADDRGRLIWYGVLGAVILAGLVAVLASRGTDRDAADEGRTQQTSDVQIGSVPAASGSEPGSEAAPAPAADPLPQLPDSGADPAVGQVIPTVTGKTLDGEPISIGPDGRAKLVLFVAHWCPHCQREIPVLTEYLRDHPLPETVDLVTVSTSVAEERGNYPPKSWLDNAGWTAPVMADSADNAVAAAYGLTSFPYFVAVDRDGKVVVRTTGELSTQEFARLVEAAQTGTPPT